MDVGREKGCQINGTPGSFDSHNAVTHPHRQRADSLVRARVFVLFTSVQLAIPCAASPSSIVALPQSQAKNSNLIHGHQSHHPRVSRPRDTRSGVCEETNEA